MRENRLAKRSGRTRGRLAPELLLLSVAYGLGLAAGHFIGRAAGADAEIRTYLAAYAQALESGSTATAASLLGVAMAYYRMPCAVFFCGFLRNANYFFCGIFLLEGFLLSYAVACFSGALGQQGVLISLCTLGIRAMFVLPVSLFLALYRRRSAPGSAGRRAAKQMSLQPGRAGRFLFLIPALLALGVLCELTFVPKLTALALKFIV